MHCKFIWKPLREYQKMSLKIDLVVNSTGNIFGNSLGKFHHKFIQQMYWEFLRDYHAEDFDRIPLLINLQNTSSSFGMEVKGRSQVAPRA